MDLSIRVPYFSTDSKQYSNGLRLSHLSGLELIDKCNQNTAK